MAAEGWVLLVEDESDERLLLRHALQSHAEPWRLITACDGTEALGLLHDYVDDLSKPVLVLLDLKLPRTDGLEVLKCVRADPRTRHIPVVIFTSSVEHEDLRRCYEAGCNSYVRKPVEFGRYAATVRQIVDYWTALNQPLDEAAG